MSGFGDEFTKEEEDPAAEFLAREQDELAGLEDEVKPAAIAAPLFNGGKCGLLTNNILEVIGKLLFMYFNKIIDF